MSCIDCHSPFPLNYELASLPDASRVAFDPHLKRLWRICTECGHWNLLGPDATTAAMPEVESRFRAAPKVQAEGVALVTLSRKLQLVQIDDQLAPGVNERWLVSLRRSLLAATWIRVTLFAGWCIYMATQGGRVGSWEGILNLATIWAWLSAATALRPLYYQNSIKLSHFATSLVTFIAASWLGFYLKPVASVSGYVILATAGLLLAPLVPMYAVNVKCADGKRIKIDEQRMDDIQMEWSTGGSIELYNTAKNEVLVGADAIKVLHGLLEYCRKMKMPTPATTGRAVELVRATGGIQGLLAVLEGYRSEQSGRIIIATLPPVYQLALFLALAEDKSGDLQKVSQLRLAAESAAEIAEEAERLDRKL